MNVPMFLGFIYIPKSLNSSSINFLVTRGCSSSMKAVLLNEFGPPKLLKVHDVPRPQVGNSEVLVKVQAVGVNPVDCLIREGAFTSLPKLPIILGKEASGIIEQVGPSVGTFKKGDRVTCCLPRDGGYAEYVTCQEKQLIPLSDKLSFSEGAALYVAYFIAHRALVTKCRIKKGESLLIHGGSGGVGIAAIQIAKSKGLIVFGTASSDEGLSAMKAAGADHVINHKEPDYLLKLAASVDLRGFDVIIENCAEENLGKDLLVLAKNGRIAIIGAGASLRHIPGKKPQTSIAINPRSLIFTEGVVHGVNLAASSEEDFISGKQDILRGMEEGWLRPIVNKEFPLSQAWRAHELLFSDAGAQGKIILNLQMS